VRELPVVPLLDRVEDATSLDAAVAGLSRVAGALLRPRALRDLLHGVPAGHPLHPVAVLVPVGGWLGAAVLDAVPGNARAARTLVGVGILGALPSVASGLTDWSELHRRQQRTGLVHAVGNAAALALYSASYVQRRRGRQVSGALLGWAGLGVVGAASFVGGHLSYRQAAGANHAEHVPHRFPAGWQVAGSVDAVTEGELSRLEVQGTSLVALRRGDRVDVLSNVGSHLGAPLSEGELVLDGNEARVRDPWRGSEYSFATGRVVHGPATAPQPRLETRVVDGRLEVRLPGADGEVPRTDGHRASAAARG